MILVVDTETTGLDPASDAVVEVAAVGLHPNPWRVTGGSGSLVAPGRMVPPAAAAVHHLRDEDLRDAPHARLAVATCLFDILGPLSPRDVAAVAAHNADFDAGFLRAQVDRALGAPMQWLCTWRCARHLWPDAPGYGNQVLRYYLRVEPALPPGLAPHRALYDALTTAAILQRMLEERPLPELLALQREPVLLKTVAVGKYRGTAWSAVDPGYLRWVTSPDRIPPFDRDVLHTARYYLNGGTSTPGG